MGLHHALAWYAREALRLEQLFNTITVKRRRNVAQPVKRRRSAFRDPMICIDFLAMAWLGATRLSHIDSYLRPRDHLAELFGLRRFCDHTTAHNFLNACHRTHVRQLEDVNARLLRAHGSALGAPAAILDLDVAQRTVRRTGRRRNWVYRWPVAFCAGEALEQTLARRVADWRPIVLDVLAKARGRLRGKPRLVRLAGACVSPPLLRALARQRLAFLTTVTWAWALAHRPEPRGALRWSRLDDEVRVLDLGVAERGSRGDLPFRTLLVERRARLPGARRDRSAILTSLVDEAPPAIVRLAASGSRIRRFFGHPRWPLGDGKLPSSDPRGNAAYLLLATIGMNVLRLFARHLGGEWTAPRLHAHLRVVPLHTGGRRESPTLALLRAPH
jgi:hypothetical protein